MMQVPLATTTTNQTDHGPILCCHIHLCMLDVGACIQRALILSKFSQFSARMGYSSDTVYACTLFRLHVYGSVGELSSFWRLSIHSPLN